MYYFLAHFPKINYSEINKIRDIYDPNRNFLAPHIAIVFPVDSLLSEDVLIAHIESIVEDFPKFLLTLKGLEKSWDHYLYLTVNRGKDKIISLHDRLYTGILKEYWIKAVPYKPHVSLGFFADKQAKFDMSDIEKIQFKKDDFDAAISQAKKYNFDFSIELNTVHLIKRNDKDAPAIIVREFKLV